MNYTGTSLRLDRFMAISWSFLKLYCHYDCYHVYVYYVYYAYYVYYVYYVSSDDHHY